MRVRVKRLAQVWLVMTSLINVTVTVPPQLSLVVAEAGLGAGTWLAHCTVTGAGQVIIGSELSKTVIVCEQVAELPQASVAR